MNTLPTSPPNTSANAKRPLVALVATLYGQRSRMRAWGFSAAVRLSDQDKPIILKLLVELAIVIRILTLLVRSADAAPGKPATRRAPRPFARYSSGRITSARRIAAATVHQRVVVAVQHKSRSERPGKHVRTCRPGSAGHPEKTAPAPL